MTMKLKRDKKESTESGSFHIGRALRLVLESTRNLTLLSIIFVIVLAILPLASLYLMKLVVDEVVSAQEAADPDSAYNNVVILIILTGILILLEAICTSLFNLVKMAQSQRTTNHIQEILHAKSIEVDLEFYENPEYYDKMHRAQSDATIRPTSIVNGLMNVLQSSLTLIAMGSLLFLLDWYIPPILLVAAIPGIFVKIYFSEEKYSWTRQRTSMQRKAWYYHTLLTMDQYAKEVRLFNYGSHFMRHHRELRRKLNREELGLAKKRTLAELAAKACTTTAILGIYAYIAYKTVHGDISLGDMVMFFGAFARGMTSIEKLLTGISKLYEDNLFISNFYEFLNLKPNVVDPEDPVPLPGNLTTGITFKNVRFSYPTTTREVLNDISFSVRPGEHVALVGVNGAGKTTLIKLLCRLYDPQEGIITIDDVDLKRYSLSELRSGISVLFQDYAKYHLTARENIWLGNTALSPSDKNIEESAKLSGADQVIETLPQHYDTILGKWFENGEELSIGQWQKIALARAFLRDSQIIILDEPTSALDAKTEFEVFSTFNDLTRGQTAIIISHRLSTVKMVDRILVLDNGSIIESGTHDELIEHGGMYADLFEMQAKSYR